MLLLLIGDAVQGDFAAANLAGISGYEEGNDYYQSNWSELGGVLADAINKSCCLLYTSPSPRDS